MELNRNSRTAGLFTALVLIMVNPTAVMAETSLNAGSDRANLAISSIGQFRRQPSSIAKKVSLSVSDSVSLATTVAAASAAAAATFSPTATIAASLGGSTLTSGATLNTAVSQQTSNAIILQNINSTSSYTTGTLIDGQELTNTIAKLDSTR